VVTVTIPVDVAGAKGLTGPDGVMPLVDYWQQVVDRTWGASFQQLPYKDCYLLSLKVKLRARPDDFGRRDGSHRIIVGAPNGGVSFDGTGFDGAPETSTNPKTGDGTRSFEGDRDGAIPADAPPTVVAHEFGHLMGLGDDRANGVATPGREGTLMVGGARGVDPNQPLTIDQDLIDRIGKVIEQRLKQEGDALPPCERWQGPFRGTVTPQLCTSTQAHGTMTLGLADNGPAAVGTLDITYDPYTCGGTAGVPTTSFTSVTVSGDKSRRRFSLATHYGPGDFSFNLTITGPRAEGTFSVLNAAGSVAVHLRCTGHCPDENS
jgi:hypothetical protein